jgi:Fungal specific transcription factor domain
MDEKIFLELWKREPQRVSSALMCNVSASALLFWDNSESLSQHPRPDLAFAWNQAVAALQEDFMAPSMSTIHAALLNMVGRPVLGITGNIVNAGRTSTLATSLGLHRDPTAWKATPHEKNVRIRLWWGVLIHDYWSALDDGDNVGLI